MNRFFIPQENIDGETIRLTDPHDVHHLIKVLRVRTGEEVYVSDGEGRAVVAVLQKSGARSAEMKIIRIVAQKKREELSRRLSLAVAVPKKTHFEEVIDKAVQLGVDEIIPLVTDRTRTTIAGVRARMDRYRRVMTAAAQQSGVLFLPLLANPQTFIDCLAGAASYDVRLLPHLAGDRVPLRDVLVHFSKGRILACVGPEGDFSPQEVIMAQRAGFQAVGLGDSVLRVDTAAISIAAFVRFSWGET